MMIGRRVFTKLIIGGCAWLSVPGPVWALDDIEFDGHTISGQSVYIMWEEHDDASYYVLTLRERGGGTLWSTNGSGYTVHMSPSDGIEWEAGGRYVLRVEARDASGNRIARGAHGFTFTGDPDPEPSLHASDEGHTDYEPGSGELCVSWTGSADTDVESWVIRWREPGGEWLGSHEQTRGDNDYLITGLESGTQYVIRVEQVMSDGSSQRWVTARVEAP